MSRWDKVVAEIERRLEFQKRMAFQYELEHGGERASAMRGAITAYENTLRVIAKTRTGSLQENTK